VECIWYTVENTMIHPLFGLSRGLPPYQVAPWSIQPFGHDRYRPKIGGLCSFGERELGPHLTQRGLSRGLPPYQAACWSIQPFGHHISTLQTGQTWQTHRQDRTDNSLSWTGQTTVCPVLSVCLSQSDGTGRSRRTVLQTVAKKRLWRHLWNALENTNPAGQV